MSMGPVQKPIVANGLCFSLFSIIIFQADWSVNIFFKPQDIKCFHARTYQGNGVAGALGTPLLPSVALSSV